MHARTDVLFTPVLLIDGVPGAHVLHMHVGLISNTDLYTGVLQDHDFR